MPITQSAKKALRQNIKHRKVNEKRKAALKNAVKTFQKLLAGSKGDAVKNLPDLYQHIDKAAKTHIISHNRAGRMKSRLSRKIGK